MNHEITTKTELSIDQQKTLVEIIGDQFGPHLTFDEFTDQVLLLFEDISGGFTTTRRRGPQSFKVLPVVVYRVYTDGRPDELIRGADIVGTPLTCFEKISSKV